jgi:hypothetical protein
VLGGARRAFLALTLERLALPLVLALAALNVLWQLGSSSYYVDEILSVNDAVLPLGSLIHAIGISEISPPAYFVLLHEWAVRVGASGLEWTMRLPAAACVVALVGVVYWLARLLSERRAVALGAATLCALSPFELEFGQLAQGYAATALAVAVAVSAAVAGDRDPRHRVRWWWISLGASLFALLCHYTAALIVAPLCIWVLTRRTLSARWRWAFAGACAAVQLALVPLLLTQHNAHPVRGVGASAALTPSTLLTMLEAPFSGRVDALRPLGVAVTLSALVLLTARTRFGGPGFGARRLVLIVAIGEPAVLILASALGGRFWGLLMLNRYAAVAVPFLIVAIALAVEAAPRVPAAVLALGAVVMALAGTVENHRARSFFLDARGVAAFMRVHVRSGDVVVEPPYTWSMLPLHYYGLWRLHPIVATDPAVKAVLKARAHRIWVLSVLPSGQDPRPAAVLAAARPGLRAEGYRPLEAKVFPSAGTVVSLLAAPATGSVAR